MKKTILSQIYEQLNKSEDWTPNGKDLVKFTGVVEKDLANSQLKDQFNSQLEKYKSYLWRRNEYLKENQLTEELIERVKKGIVNQGTKSLEGRNSIVNATSLLAGVDHDVKNKLVDCNKPLGDLGDITLNQIISKADEELSPIIKWVSNKIDIGISLNIISTLIVYKAVTNLYIKNAYPEFNNKSIVDVLKAKDFRSLQRRNSFFYGVRSSFNCRFFIYYR